MNRRGPRLWRGSRVQRAAHRADPTFARLFARFALTGALSTTDIVAVLVPVVPVVTTLATALALLAAGAARPWPATAVAAAEVGERQLLLQRPQHAGRVHGPVHVDGRRRRPATRRHLVRRRRDLRHADADRDLRLHGPAHRWRRRTATQPYRAGRAHQPRGDDAGVRHHRQPAPAEHAGPSRPAAGGDDPDPDPVGPVRLAGGESGQPGKDAAAAASFPWGRGPAAAWRMIRQRATT